MTEIPEHLLKRAAAARAAKSGEEAPADAPADAAGTDAPAAAAAPAAVEPTKAAPAPLPTLDDEVPAAKPDSPVVAAAKARKRIPFWAAPVLAILPLWGVIYLSAVQPPPAGESDPLVIGKAVYAADCASCHGSDGAGVKSGGTGQQLSDEEVLKTFPDPLEQVYWEHYGASDGGARKDGTYGDPNREGGARDLTLLPGVMPGFPDMTPEEMAAVVIYIRQELAGGDPKDDPNFNAELFAADPSAMAALVESVTALDAGDPDAVTKLDGAEKAS